MTISAVFSDHSPTAGPRLYKDGPEVSSYVAGPATEAGAESDESAGVLAVKPYWQPAPPLYT